MVEVLVAATLLAIVIVGILPLFIRAMQSTLYGGDASQLTAFLRAGIERMNQRSANHASFDTQADGSGAFTSAATVLRYAPQHYHEGQGDLLGDEVWNATAPTSGELSLWRMRFELRKYALADVHSGNITITANPAAAPSVTQVGHPKLFDVPLVVAGELGDINEMRMIGESQRALGATGIDQRFVVSQYRVY